MAIQKLGILSYPVRDLAASVAFYQDALGLTLKLRDGDRWAGFDCGTVTLALEPGTPRPGDGPVACFKVDDLAATMAALQDRGIQFPDGVQQGPHEQTVSFRDPDGYALLLYAPR